MVGVAKSLNCERTSCPAEEEDHPPCEILPPPSILLLLNNSWPMRWFFVDCCCCFNRHLWLGTVSTEENSRILLKKLVIWELETKQSISRLRVTLFLFYYAGSSYHGPGPIPSPAPRDSGALSIRSCPFVFPAAGVGIGTPLAALKILARDRQGGGGVL